MKRISFGQLVISASLGLLAVFSSHSSIAQQGWNVRMVGQLGGSCGPVQIQGTYLYVGEGPNLRIVDLFDPTLPVPLGCVRLETTAFTSSNPYYKGTGAFGLWSDISVSGGRAYAALGDLFIVDVSNPSSPTLQARLDTPGHAYGLYVVGPLVYVAGSGGLTIVDVSNPWQPIIRGTYPQPDSLGVFVSGSLAYLAAGTAGLKIVNISNPSSPTTVGSYGTPGYFQRICVSNQTAFVVDTGYYNVNHGLRIIDVSNPSSPTLRTSYHPASGEDPRDVQVVGNLAYLCVWNSDFEILDITNPSLPVLRGRGPGGVWERVSVSGGLAVSSVSSGGGDGVWGDFGVRILDVTQPALPTEIGSYLPPLRYSQGGVTVCGNVAYIGDWNGLGIVDVTKPFDPTLLSYWRSTGRVQGVDVTSAHAYVADSLNGFHVLDVSEPSLPNRLGGCTIPTFRSGVLRIHVPKAAQGGNPSPSPDLRAPDVADAPVLWVGPRDLMSQTGDMAYVACEDGLYIVDVSNPTSPTVRGHYPTPDQATDVDTSGNLAYVVWRRYAGGGGLKIIDVSNPSSPTLRGSYPFSLGAYGIEVQGNLAYVAVTSELHVLDVSNPSQPTARGYLYVGYTASYDVSVTPSRAYIVGGYTLAVCDINNPSQPALSGSIPTPGYSGGDIRQWVFVSNGLAYLGRHDAGLQVYEYIGPPQRPTNLSPPNGATGVSLSPTLASSLFADAWTSDTHQASHWQVRVLGGGYSAPVFDSGVDQTHLTSIGVPPGYLSFNTRHYWHVRYRNYGGAWSPWSYETSFVTTNTTTNRAPNAPSNVTPTSGATNVSLAPILIASAFSDPDAGDYHTASQWQVRSSAGTYSAPVYDSSVSFYLTALGVPVGSLAAGQTYYWRVRYKDSFGAWSAWSPETPFETVTVATISMPRGLRASPGARSVRLTWLANSDTNLAGYNLYRDVSMGGSFATKINSTLITNTEYLDDNLALATTYWYKITAVATDGRESPKSVAVWATPGTTKISMPDVRGLAGSTVTLLINLDNANGITGNGMDIRISYDRNVLTPVAYHKTVLTQLFTFASNIGSAQGQVNFSGISGAGAQIQGEGHILDVDFFVTAGTPAWTTSILAFVDVFLYDAQANPISVDDSDTALFTVASSYILGDLNGDGIVTSADALIAQQIAMGQLVPTPLQQAAGDANGDGLIDAADVTLILRLAVGLPITAGPGGSPPQEGRGPSLAATNYLVSIGRVQGAPGQTVAVPVTISDAVALAGCDLYVSYDPTKLIFESASKGPLTQGNFTLQTRNLVGQVRLTASAPTHLPGGGGQLFVLNFRIPANAQWSQTPLTVTKAKLSGEQGENLDWQDTFSVANGWISTGLVTRAKPSWNLLR